MGGVYNRKWNHSLPWRRIRRNADFKVEKTMELIIKDNRETNNNQLLQLSAHYFFQDHKSVCVLQKGQPLSYSVCSFTLSNVIVKISSSSFFVYNASPIGSTIMLSPL